MKKQKIYKDEKFSHLNETIDIELIESLQNNMVPFKQLMTSYSCAIMEVETKFKVLNAEYSLQYDRNPIESIKSRLKSVEGIIEKTKRKNIPFDVLNIEQSISDIAGVRVICSFKEDIYEISKCFLEQDDIRLVEMKDYIKNPKENGYRSLHMIIEVPIFLQKEKKYMKVEVQLRTIAMDFWASLEHKVKYKKNIPLEFEQELVSELKNCADISDSLDARMEKIRLTLTNYK